MTRAGHGGERVGADAVCGVGPEDPRREIQAFSSKEDLFSQMEEEDKQDLE